MKTSTVLAVLLLQGCASLTPRERHVLEISAAVLVAGAVADHQPQHHAGPVPRIVDPPRYQPVLGGGP